MDIDLVNHRLEIKKYEEYLNDNQKNFVIFSKEGVGKTSFIEHISHASINKYYINVKAVELNAENHASDYYFMKKFICSLNSSFPDKCINIINLLCKDSLVDISLSLNIFIASINFEPHFKDSTLKSLTIKAIKAIDEPLYVHIENVEKIDRPSLLFFVRLIKEIDNIHFFFECTTDGLQVCQYLNEQFNQFSVDVKYLEIKMLDWEQVKIVLQKLNLCVDDKEREIYKELDGNIKTLIFKHQINENKCLNINIDRQFILNFISNCREGISLFEIYNIFKKYNSTLSYQFSIIKLENDLRYLQDIDCVFNNNNYYFITDFGICNTTSEKEEMIKSILSNYYMPIIELGNKDYIDNIIKGLRILLTLYIRTQDERINKILPYIDMYLIPLKVNAAIVDEIYDTIDRYDSINVDDLKLILIRIYIRLGYFKVAYEKLKKLNSNSDLKNVLLATIMVHLNARDPQTEEFIMQAIKKSKDKKFISAFQTCLVSLNMRIKTTSELKDYVNDLDFKKISKVDLQIIKKNLSIYSDNKNAIKLLKEIFRLFRDEKHNHLLTATGITLATRYAQAGHLRSAKRIIKLLEKDCILSEEDQAYIDNNISAIDLLSNNINESTYERLINTYYYCEDEYSKLLVANNLLIYFVNRNNMSEAERFANIIENIGVEKYKFDEYQHVVNLNLMYYYDSICNVSSDIYRKNLDKLLNCCFSSDLKKYIKSQLENINLNNTDKWYFMSQFNFRPAFMGHWIINNFDY